MTILQPRTQFYCSQESNDMLACTRRSHESRSDRRSCKESSSLPHCLLGGLALVKSVAVRFFDGDSSCQAAKQAAERKFFRTRRRFPKFRHLVLFAARSRGSMGRVGTRRSVRCPPLCLTCFAERLHTPKVEAVFQRRLF